MSAVAERSSGRRGAGDETRWSVGPVRIFLLLVVLSVLWSFSARPALAGLQVSSGTLASCAGGGSSVDLVATGTVGDVAASKTSSRVQVRVERVVMGERDYAGEALVVLTDSVTNGGNTGAVGFREGARYELYLKREGDAWNQHLPGDSQAARTPRRLPDHAADRRPGREDHRGVRRARPGGYRGGLRVEETPCGVRRAPRFLRRLPRRSDPRRVWS